MPVSPYCPVQMSHILAEGTYELSVDVKNPRPGPHTKYWTLQAVWPAKTVVQVSCSGKGVVYLVVPNGVGHIDQDDDRFDLIAAHLSPIVETPSLWLVRAQADYAALAILDELVTAGQITLADVQRATKKLINR